MIEVSNSTKGKPLSSIKTGDLGAVVRFTNDMIANKLMSMGLMPGSSVRLLRKASLGGTFYIKANNRFYLALRKQEAECIILKK